MAVQRLEGRHQFRRQTQRVGRGPPAALLRHLFADVLPQLAELGHLGAGDVVGHRHPRQLDDAAFDGVHEREVARGPREQRPLGIARPAQEERRRRQVDDALHTEPALDGLKARHPDARGLAVLLRFLPIVALERAFGRFGRLLPIAVVGLVVEHADPLEPHQLGHHPLQHLPVGLLRPQRGPPALEQRAAHGRDGQRPARLERVVVGDDDLRPFEVAEHVRRDQFAARVVAVGIVRLEHAQAPADRHAGRDHQEAPREAGAAGAPDRVEGLPRDQQGHDGGLAGAGRELEGGPVQHGGRVRRRAGVRVRQMIEVPASVPAEARRDLGQPDQGLDRLDLAEERPDVAEGVVAPVAQEARGLRRNPPRALGQSPPVVDGVADAGDERGQVVLLPAGPDRLRGLVGDQFQLPGAAFPRGGDRRDVRRGPPRVDDAAGRPVALVQLPVAPRVLVGRVQDRPCVEGVGLRIRDAVAGAAGVCHHNFPRAFRRRSARRGRSGRSSSRR